MMTKKEKKKMITTMMMKKLFIQSTLSITSENVRSRFLSHLFFTTVTTSKPFVVKESIMFDDNSVTKFKPIDVNDSYAETHLVNYIMIEQSNTNVSILNNQLRQHFFIFEYTTLVNSLNHPKI